MSVYGYYGYYGYNDTILTYIVSHKKRVLLRWQGSEVTKEPSFPLSLGEEPAMSLSEAKEHDPPSLEDVNDCADTSDAVGVDVIKGRGSPLFEEFSDSEEFVEGDNERHAQLTPDITPTTCLPQTSDTTGMTTPISHSPHLPPAITMHLYCFHAYVIKEILVHPRTLNQAYTKQPLQEVQLHLSNNLQSWIKAL